MIIVLPPTRMTHRLAPRDLALTLCVVVMWGFSFVPIVVALREIPPFALAALRFFFAAVPAVFFVRRPRMPMRLLVAYGLAIGVLMFGILFLGMKLGMSAGLSSLVMQIQAFFTIGLGVAFLGDRSHAENIAGAIVAALGIVLLAAFKLKTGAGSTFTGLLLVIAAAFAWSVGNIVAKYAAGKHDPDMLALVVWACLVPPLPLAAISYLTEGGDAAFRAVFSASALAWSCTLFLAWVATVFGFVSWARLLHRYPTALISPFSLLVPVSGLISGAVFLRESLAPLQLAGVALVLAGLVVNIYGGKWLSRARHAQAG